jgi:hypothetical protein
MEIVDRVGLGAEQLARLRAELGAPATLAEVLRWGFAARPPREVAAVVVQDEYTHDVVLPWQDGLYLVFDTT